MSKSYRLTTRIMPNQTARFFRGGYAHRKATKSERSFDEKSMNVRAGGFFKRGCASGKLTSAKRFEVESNARLRRLNDALIQVERQFIDASGLRNRNWYKHQIYAPGFYTGYAAQPLTDFRQALDDRNSTNARESLTRIVEAIKRATDVLRQVREN